VSGRANPSRDRLVVVLLSAATTLSAACDSARSPTAATDTSAGVLPLARRSEHFLLRYSEPTAALVDAYVEALETSWPRVDTDLGPLAPAPIEAHLHPDASSLAAATGFHAAGAVESATRFHLVAVPFAPRTAVHEFAHAATLQLAPRSGDNPVWLWEATALFEAGQLVDPRTVPYLAGDEFPTLAELDRRDGHYSIYDVGYTLAETIVETWGIPGLRRLIGVLGDVEAALGISARELERRWRDFVRARYL
jgi:hypothetical protein